MKRIKSGKIIRVALAILVGIAVVGVFCWPRKQPPPQVVTLPDGSQWRFVGVTYGTNHVWGSLAARLVHKLPGSVEERIRKIVGTRLGPIASRITPVPSLCAWFKHVGTNWPAAGVKPPVVMNARLADEHGEKAGTLWRGFVDSEVWIAEFRVAPRRNPVLLLLISDTDDQYRTFHEVARVRFPNPLYGRFPEWEPEPIPAVKMAGDLEARLDNFMTGMRNGGGTVILTNGNRVPGFLPAQVNRSVDTVFDVSLKSSRGSNEEWVVQSAELSDATGNMLGSPSNVSIGGNAASPMFFLGGPYRFAMPGSLWSDEGAWRLKLELKRTSGFAPDAFLTFRNVPVPKAGTTNHPCITNIVGGMPIVLKEFAWNQAIAMYGPGGGATRPESTRIAIELPSRPEGVAVDFVKLTMDTGEEPLLRHNTWSQSYRAFEFDTFSDGVRTVDITLVVQKTRTVEFLVKPPGGK